MDQTTASTPADDRAPSPPAISEHAGRSVNAIAWFVALAVLFLVADLAIKEWSFRSVAGQRVILTRESAADPYYIRDNYPHDPVVVLPHVLSLHLTTNTGAVFGLGQGNRALFITVSVIAVAVISWLFWHCPAGAWVQQASFALILAGALGNLYDRAIYSQVRDMFWLFPGVDLPFGLTWPGGETQVYPWIFNFADVSLLLGIGLMVLMVLRSPKKPVVDPADPQ